jgi:hypothetical protein
MDGYLLHPLGYCTGTPHVVELCKGYNFWSGIGSDISEITLVFMVIGALLAFWHHHNCHAVGCRRIGHMHPDFHWPSCKTHWNDKPDHVK